MRNAFKSWPALTLTAMLALSACKSAPTHVYSLMSQPGTRINSSTTTLRVDAVHVPPDWDRIEILSPTSAGDLKINDLDRWSAPLAQATRQVLTADLDSRLPSGTVIYPHLAKSTSTLGISVDILQFTIDGSQGSMLASWLLTPAQAPDTARRSSATVTTTVTGTEPAAIARAWSLLAGQIADRIAADAAAIPADDHQ